MKRLYVNGTAFYDEDGNEVILNGICFICREPEKGYLEPEIHSLLPIYAKRGMNCVRLGIFWDGVEPEPGKYDEKYLDSIAKVVETAEQNNFYVFLDMHQDLFSRKFIDGAPLWATLDEGLTHPKDCNIWYEAYIKSPAVIKTADNFWANKPAADGVGLIDHYAHMWKHIARRYKGYSNLLGLEPMNEPYMGSIAPAVFAASNEAILKKNKEFDLTNMETVKEEDRSIMQTMMTEAFMKFDRETLMPFYNRITGAIREESNVPVVTGGNIYCSSFVKSGITNLRKADGGIDTQQIYGPHGYDAVVDTDQYDNYNKENVSYVFSGKRETQMELNLPVIVGEWGNFPSGSFTNDLIRYMTEILEQYLWGSTYHQYNTGMEADPNYDSLERGYPAQISGHLISYHYDYDKKQLSAQWKPEKGGVSRLYLPDIGGIDTILLEKELEAKVEVYPIADRKSGWIEIRMEHEKMVNLVIG